MCSLSMYCTCHLVNMKLSSPTFKVMRKIGDRNFVTGGGDWLNENLSQGTIKFS